MSGRFVRLSALGTAAILGLATAVVVTAPPSAAASSPAHSTAASAASTHRSTTTHRAAHSAAPRRSVAQPATALAYAVNLGYADNVRANPVNFPTPWNGAPNVVFEGCTGSCELDGGAVQVVNTSTHPITVQSITITYDTCVYDIWPTNVRVLKGQSMIIDQTQSGATSGCVPETGTMDGSDIGPGGVSWAGNCSQSGVIPQVAVKVAGVTTTYADTGQVLNTGGVDGADCNPTTSNESEQWTPAGSSICPGSTLTLTPASVQKLPSASVTMTATFANSCGDPLSGVPVNFAINSGPDTGTTGSGTTNSAGKATFSFANNGTQGIDFVTASIDNYIGTITSATSYVYFEQASLTLSPGSGVPGDTISYTGRKFAAGETVELHANSPSGQLLATGTANGSGVVTGTFVVPVPTGTAMTEVVAVGLTSGRQGWSLFSVGCTDDWVAPVSGDWSTPADWSTGSVPSSSDVACIILPGAYTVQLNQSYTVAGLLLGASSGAGTQTLVLNGRNLNLTLNGASTIFAHGVLSMTSVDGNYSALGGTGTLTNDGVLKTVNANGSSRYLRMNLANDSGGLIQIANFDTRFDQNYTFTNNGTLKLLSGAAFAVSAGTFVQSGGTITVPASASFGLASATVTASGGALTGSVTITSSTVADTGLTGGTLLLRCTNTFSGTIAADQVADVRGDNCGTSQLNLSGNVTNNGTLELDSANGSSATLNGGTLTNDASFITNQGNGGTRYLRSDLTNAAGATATVNAYDTRMDDGNTFTNAGSVVLGSAGNLSFYGGSTFTTTGSVTVPVPGALYVQSSTYNDNGGTLTGTAYLNGSTLNEGGGSGGRLVLECGDTLAGTIAAGETVEVQGNSCGTATTNLSGTVVNNGTLTMTSTNGYSAFLSGGALTNNAAFSTVQGNGGTRYLRSDITNAAGATATINAYDTRMDNGNTFTNAGALTIGSSGDLQFFSSTFTTSGSISAPVAGSLYAQTSTYNDNGGTLSGTAYLNGSTLNDSGNATSGTLVLECNNTLTGVIGNGETVNVQGNGCSSASTTLSGGVVNNGTLTMTSTNGNYALISGGPLTNNGTFSTVQGNGGTRYIRVDVTNAAGATATIGDFNTQQDYSNTFDNSGTVNVPAGGSFAINGGGFIDETGSTLTVDPAGNMYVGGGATFTSNGGTLTGSVTLQSATLTDSGGTGGTYLLQCNNTLSGTVQAGQTVDAQGNTCGASTVNLDAAGVTNFGTFVLDSTNGNYVLLQGGALTNRGTVNVSSAGGGTRYLRVPVTNGSGSAFLVSAADTRQDSSTAFTNTGNGRLAIQDGGSLSLNSGSSFTQASTATYNPTVDGTTGLGYGITGGTETLAGKLKITVVGSPAGGTPYTIISNGSVSGTFASVTPPSYSVSYSPTTVTVSLPA